MLLISSIPNPNFKSCDKFEETRSGLKVTIRGFVKIKAVMTDLGKPTLSAAVSIGSDAGYFDIKACELDLNFMILGAGLIRRIVDGFSSSSISSVFDERQSTVTLSRRVSSNGRAAESFFLIRSGDSTSVTFKSPYSKREF